MSPVSLKSNLAFLERSSHCGHKNESLKAVFKNDSFVLFVFRNSEMHLFHAEIDVCVWLKKKHVFDRGLGAENSKKNCKWNLTCSTRKWLVRSIPGKFPLWLDVPQDGFSHQHDLGMNLQLFSRAL